MSLECPHCGTMKTERNGYCATFNAAQRKADRTKAKEPPKAINKVSDKRKDLNQVYAQKRDKYLFDHPHCEYHGKDCRGGILHHKAGRSGYVDQYAKDHDIPALIDDRYFMNLCATIHDMATEDSKWAIGEQISVSRTAKI